MSSLSISMGIAFGWGKGRSLIDGRGGTSLGYHPYSGRSYNACADEMDQEKT